MDIQPVDLETIRSWGAEGKFLGGEDGGGDTGRCLFSLSSLVAAGDGERHGVDGVGSDERASGVTRPAATW
jgi:hypothetical protein